MIEGLLAELANLQAQIDAGGGAKDDIFYENNQIVVQDYTLTVDTNAMSTGPITIDDGVTVTIPDGSIWVII